jgi:predicted HicB family RNase H-like nuclease
MDKHYYHYKCYTGSIEINFKKDYLEGRVLYIDELIPYRGETLVKLKKDFERAVDEYLEECKINGIEPKKPFTGSLILRISPELQEETAKMAEGLGKSLNDYIRDALKKENKTHVRPPLFSL